MKGDILHFWGTLIFLVYYTILCYQKREVYRVETMDMGRFRWTNGVSGKCIPNKYYITYCKGYAILVGVIQCWMMPHCWPVSNTPLTHRIIIWLMYSFYEAVYNVYGDILTHKHKKTPIVRSIYCVSPTTSSLYNVLLIHSSWPIVYSQPVVWII